MQKSKSSKIHVVLFGVVMLMSLVSMLYFGHRKEGYHVDEIYSYGLANSEYLPFMHFGESGYDVKDWMLEYGAGESFVDLFRNVWKDYKILKEYDFNIYASPVYQDYLTAQANSADTRTTTWVPGTDYLHYVAVSPDNTFNYASVYYNQRGDVHPPFFYMLLHTVCSFFVGSFSKWYGIALNIVFMMLTLVVVYRMCSRHLGGENFGLCVAAVYGLSCGYVSSAIFIRMYAILTFMVVASCYLHLEIAANDFEISRKTRWKLVAVTFLGFFTHYYFVRYAIGAAAVSCVWMLWQKRYRRMFGYIATMAVTGAAGICVWPFAIRHVFQGYRGVTAIKDSLSGGFYWIKTKVLLGQIWGQIAGGQWWLVILPAVVLAAVALLWKRKEIPYGKIMLLGLPILFYVAATAQIVPIYTDRYVMCSYSFWCILMVGGIYHTIRIVCEKFELAQTAKGKRVTAAVLAVSMLGLVIANNCYANESVYLYTGEQEIVEVPENTDCVYVLPDGDWNESAGDSAILAKCRKVGLVYESNLPALKEGYHYTEGDYLLICVQKNMDVDKVIGKVHEVLGTEGLEEISRSTGTSAVRILFQK